MQRTAVPGLKGFLEKIASLRQRSGENKFLSQMMLQPVNFRDSVLNPERLVAYKR